MTEEQIIKAVGLCSSEHLGCEDGCPYTSRAMDGELCSLVLKGDAFAVLKRKNAEIEELYKSLDNYILEIHSQKAEIERLREFGDKLRKAYAMAYNNGFELCKGLFFNKLENALADNIDISHAQYESIMFDVHNIVDELKIKELTE